jgi:hypothetical protein
MSVAVILQALGWVSAVGLVTVHLMIKRGRLRSDGRAYRIAGCAAAASVVAASVSAGIWPVAVLGLLWLRIEVFGHRHHVPENQFPALGPGPVFAQGHVITAGQAADRPGDWPGDWAGETSADRPGDQPADQTVDHVTDPSRQPERMPWFLAGAMDRGRSPARGAAKTKTKTNTKGRARPGARPAVPQQVPQQHPHRPQLHLPHPHLPHPHLPHPHLPHPHLGRRTVDRVFKVEMGIVISIALVLFVIWAEEQRASFRTTTDYVVCNWIEGC